MEQKCDPVVNVGELPQSISEQLIERLTSSINGKLKTLPQDSYTVCIYKVSEEHRKTNEGAYTPRLVSLGPLHHGKTQLQTLEVYKLKCLNNFLTRYGVDLSNLIKFAAEEEKYVRGCYENTIKLTSEVFAEIILLDGIFIVELFLKNRFLNMRERSDIIFENRWMSNDLLHDMLLLENQLPTSVTLGLFKFVDVADLRGLSLYDLAREYFKNVGNTGKLMITNRCKQHARHLVEFLTLLHRPLKPRDNPSTNVKFEYTRSATELQEAGVKFFPGNEDCLFEVSFSRGELTIPKLIVNDSTEVFLRNLIAFEQCGYYSKDITSYVILMDSLIDTAWDVDLLVKHGIIENALGDGEQVADLFNRLYKEVVTDTSDFYFAKLCYDLNEYRKDYWHEWKSTWFKWKVVLRRDYFGNPWSLISVVAAVILLILTIIQTVCSVLQVK